jgi:hypothetical protein
MPAQAPARLETILKKARQQGFVLRQGDHAITKVTGREHAVLATQTARTASVIRDGHYRCEIAYCVLRILLLARSHVSFQAAQQHGKSRAAADGDNPQRSNALKR